MLKGSSSVTHSDSSKRSSSSDPEDATTVYLKDNVTIHPTQYTTKRISGRLKLNKQGSSLYMLFKLTKHSLWRSKPGATRRLNSQKKSLEVVESVGVSGKVDPNKTVKYFRLEIIKFVEVHTLNLINLFET
uniref:Uncharacterized protein n=1 Tax=Lactuca sativa TaxID=4236 RepID=A0A9R1UUI3_LACSA|nr:hypothetical protein LSAT_V11C800412740 [Lactuca sativa]